MRKSEVKPVMRAPGQAPEAYYYLGRFIEDCLRIRSQHFRSREEMSWRLNRLVIQYFGSLEEDGLLQRDMNRYYNGILKDLKQDYPRFTRRRILLFSYSAARLPLSLICQLTGINSIGAVSCMKSKMKTVISCHTCLRKEQYLDLLSR